MTHLGDVKALLCDVFGTIVDWHGTVSREIERKINQDSKTANEFKRAGLTSVSFTEEWRAGYMLQTVAIANGEMKGPSSVDVMHRNILDNMLKKYELDNIWTEEEKSDLVLVWHDLDGWKDSSPGLSLLKQRFICSTLSNGNVKLLVDMAKHAKLPWDVILCGDLLNSYKPNQKMYLGACSFLQLEPGQAAMVAAHHLDLKFAKSFGLKTIYIRRPTEDTEAIEHVGANNKDKVQDLPYVDLAVDSLIDLAKYFGIETEKVEPWNTAKKL